MTPSTVQPQKQIPASRAVDAGRSEKPKPFTVLAGRRLMAWRREPGFAELDVLPRPTFYDPFRLRGAATP